MHPRSASATSLHVEVKTGEDGKRFVQRGGGEAVEPRTSALGTSRGGAGGEDSTPSLSPRSYSVHSTGLYSKTASNSTTPRATLSSPEHNEGRAWEEGNNSNPSPDGLGGEPGRNDGNQKQRDHDHNSPVYARFGSGGSRVDDG